jgi:hypothetical protein
MASFGIWELVLLLGGLGVCAAALAGLVWLIRH